MPAINRARETRVLAALLRDQGYSATQAMAMVDQVTGDDDTWTQLRLWLGFTDDDDRVATQFVVRVGRPREVVSAWGGITQDTELVSDTSVRLGVCLASTYTS